MKVLSIVETAYRATAEEQDDTILWLNTMFKKADLDVSLLLRASSVNYLVRGQDASGLSFGGREVTHPPRLDDDVSALLDAGVPVHYVSEDLVDRGIPTDRLIDGAKPISRAELPALFGQFDQIWHW